MMTLFRGHLYRFFISRSLKLPAGNLGEREKACCLLIAGCANKQWVIPQMLKEKKMRKILPLASLFLVAAMLLGCAPAATPQPAATMADITTPPVDFPEVATPGPDHSEIHAEVEELLGTASVNITPNLCQVENGIVIGKTTYADNSIVFDFTVPSTMQVAGLSHFYQVHLDAYPDLWFAVWMNQQGKMTVFDSVDFVTKPLQTNEKRYLGVPVRPATPIASDKEVNFQGIILALPGGEYQLPAPCED